MPYIIRNNTYALIPNNHKTKIIEKDKVYTIDDETINIVLENCYLNGSSLDGRKKGTTYLTGAKYKPPIILNEAEHLILVPTHSTRNKNCHWFNLNAIQKYYPLDAKKVIIIFTNNKKIEINISYNIFDKQILRATRLQSTIKKRKNQNFL